MRALFFFFTHSDMSNAILFTDGISSLVVHVQEHGKPRAGGSQGWMILPRVSSVSDPMSLFSFCIDLKVPFIKSYSIAIWNERRPNMKETLNYKTGVAFGRIVYLKFDFPIWVPSWD